jgi:predicted metalloprotease
MLVNDLLKNMAFPDPRRHLQLQPTRGFSTEAGTSDSTEKGSESGSNFVGIYILGLGMIFVLVMIVFWILAVAARRANTTDVMDTPALPESDKTMGKNPKSTLAQRQQAILELFETSQVTMVSNDTVMPARHQNKQFRQKEKAHHI